MLQRTRFGLRLRACGEDPAAAQAVGVQVAGTRTAAVCLGSAICGLGGTALAYDLHQFQAGMTGGRGFIALAALNVLFQTGFPVRRSYAVTSDGLKDCRWVRKIMPPPVAALFNDAGSGVIRRDQASTMWWRPSFAG